ncbi:MAG: hypothetical protein V7K26_30290 [Nostoc sp.]
MDEDRQLAKATNLARRTSMEQRRFGSTARGRSDRSRNLVHRQR